MTFRTEMKENLIKITINYFNNAEFFCDVEIDHYKQNGGVIAVLNKQQTNLIGGTFGVVWILF